MSSFKEIVSGEIPVLVDFHATWCGPCKALAPILEDFAKAYAGRVRVIKIDVDKNPQLAASLGVQGVPTLILYRQGQMHWRQSGVVPKSELERVVKPILT